ncbi:MAG: hypothetical protein IJX89_05315 [Alphaproteobacteria bacterium]|nr:hypothetical protein [Alphaproteobacteria bacterium]
MTLDEIGRLQNMDCPRFAAFARDKLPMPGTKKRLDEILNREIIVTDYRITKSKKRDGTDCLQLQFVLDGVAHVVFTGSSVLTDQIQAAQGNIPFRGTIVKIDRYYSFS